MCEHGSQESVVSAGPFQLASHGALAGFQARQVQSHFPQQGQVFGTMLLPVSGLILVEYHVQTPVEFVLNTPMAAHYLIETLRWEDLAHQVVPALDAGVLSFSPDGGYLPHRRRAISSLMLAVRVSMRP